MQLYQFKYLLNDYVQNEAMSSNSHKGRVLACPPHTQKKRTRGYTPASLLSNNSSLESWRFDDPELLLKLSQYVVLSEKKVPDISSNQVKPPTKKKKSNLRTVFGTSVQLRIHMAYMYLCRKIITALHLGWESTPMNIEKINFPSDYYHYYLAGCIDKWHPKFFNGQLQRRC